MFRSNVTVVLIGLVVAALAAQSANAQLIAGRSVNTEATVHIDLVSGTATPLFTLSENNIALSGVEGLAVDDANRTIYICSGLGSPLAEAIYSAHYDDRNFNDPSRIRLRKVVDLSPALRIQGLAYDTTNAKMYAVYPFGSANEGIYEVNMTTGALTLVVDVQPQASTYDLRGLDFNPADGLLYALNQSTTAANRKLISINLAGPVITDITGAGQLTAAETGLAIGNNRAYIVADDNNPSVPIRVYNLGTNSYEPTIPNPFPASNQSQSGAGWGPNALVAPAGSNLGTTISATPTNALEYPVGTQINYTAKFANFGPASATNVNYSIVLGGTATATISNISGGNAAEGPIGTVAGSIASLGVNQIETITFTATTTAAGTLTATALIPPGSNTDGYLGNNSEALSHVVRNYPAIDLVFTSVNSSPKSSVPGGLQVETTTVSTTERFRKPSGSPKGDYVALQIDTNAATTQDVVYVRRDSTNTWSTVVQEGVTTVTPGDFIVAQPLTGRRLALLDDGRYGYSIDTNAATANDEMTILYDNTNHTIVAREASLIPVVAGLGIGYGATQDSTSLTGDGKFAIRMSSMTGAGSSPNNTGIVSDSGNTLLTRGGSSIPGNQLGGGTLAVSTLDTDGFWMDCTGSNYLYTGTLTGAIDVVVVNGNVVFQEGGPVAGFTGTLTTATWGTTAGIISTQMYPNGEWWCRGTTTVTTEDFVLKGFGGTYTTVAKRGDPIFTGAGENWSDVDGFSPTFFGYAANRQGSYVLTGRTDNPNTSKNAVAVANGTTELFREGDRVDLDNNGQLDDDAFIDTFVIDMQLLTDAQDYYAVVNLRNGAGTFIGKALVHMANVGALPATGADISVTKTVSNNQLTAIGQQTVFTVTVCNKGPSDATGATMTDPIPTGLKFISATNGAFETAPNSNIVQANIGTLPSCTCQSYAITVQAMSAGNYNNTASASATQADPNLANNSASAAVVVVANADVSVTKIDNGGAPPGGQFTYTITITNNGPDTATNVLMTDTLDSLTTFVSATNGATQSSPGVVTRTFASIANGASEVVQITVNATIAGIMTNQVTVSATEADPNSGNNTAFRETPVSNNADMSVTLSDPGLKRIGENYSYTLTVFNGGPAPATNVQVVTTLPAGMNFVSATNGAVENPGGSGNVVATFANMASQASQVVVITVNVPAEGTYTVSATVDADQTDGDDLNNTAQVITRVGKFSPVRAIYTQIPGHPSANVPGLLDGADQPVVAQFDSMLNINVSSDGTRWTIDASSNLAATSIDSVMMLGSGFTGSVFAQEGKQAFGAPAGTLYTFFDDDVGFNSNNDFAWGALNSVTANSDVTYTNIGGVNANIAQTGSVVNGLQAAGNIANSTVSQHLLNDGRVGFNASNITPGSRSALCYWDSVSGINVFVERNFTSIDGDLITGLPVDRIFYTTPDGLHTLFRATIAAGSMAVYDGGRILRTGDLLPDASGTINAITEVHLADNGSWIVRGDKAGGDDWVIRNGALVAATGQSIEGGAETWGNLIGTVRVNNNGDYLITGNTNIGDPLLDGVMVLNGEVIVRESDPVDLDGNGLFDDNIFITSFSASNAWLSNNNKVHFLATIRNGEGTSFSTAFLVVDVGGCTTILGDANGSASRNGRDVQAFINCLFTGDLTHPCKCADMDGDGDIDAADATLFASALVGDP